VDADPDDATPATRPASPRSTTPRKTPAARRPASGTARGGAAAAKKPAAKTASPAAKKPTRSTARSGSVGRPAAAAAAELSVVQEPTVVEGPRDEAPAVEEPIVDEAPVIEEPVVETLPEPEPEPEPEPAAVETPLVDADLVELLQPRRPARATGGTALALTGLTKRFGSTIAVNAIDLDVPEGCFYGFVGPNGAGKTTTLSMITGLLRPDAGTVVVGGADVWADPRTAKRAIGVLPDRLRLFDRLTGAEYLQHAGALHGLDRATVARRSADLVRAFDLESASRRFVSDYSAGMVKKIAIAAAMIHAPRVLVLDEPFESVDPVSAQLVVDVLKKFAQAGGTVLLSSHSMDLVERVCDYVAIIAEGRMLAAGPLDEVLDGASLEERFVELAGGATAVEGMEWLQSFSD
jgi:ABC-2 type transport system ATP-binding protein